MKQIGRYATLLLACTLLPACSPINSIQPFDQQQAAILLRDSATANPAKQMIALNLPRKQAWKMIDLSRNHLGAPVLLLPQNESETTWSERIQTKMRPYKTDFTVNALAFVLNEIAIAKQHCPKTQSNILTQTQQSVSYQLTLADCANAANQYQVGKALNGQDGVYFVRYASVTTDALQHARMQQVIQSAKLVQNPAVR